MKPGRAERGDGVRARPVRWPTTTTCVGRIPQQATRRCLGRLGCERARAERSSVVVVNSACGFALHRKDSRLLSRQAELHLRALQTREYPISTNDQLRPTSRGKILPPFLTK